MFGKWIITITIWLGITGPCLAAPITDVVAGDGKTWAQVDLFSNLSWNDINQVCPMGVCGAGTLNGYDMEGWRWASENDIRKLFASYIGSEIDGTSVIQSFSPWAPAFFDDGWRMTVSFMEGQRVTRGSTSSQHGSRYVLGEIIDFDEPVIFRTQGTIRNDKASVPHAFNRNIANNAMGGWFYQVPAPPSTVLIIPGLALLWIRRARGT